MSDICVKANLLGTKWECLACSAIVRNPSRHREWHDTQRVIVNQIRDRLPTEGEDR
jgi:hypothetical protein